MYTEVCIKHKQLFERFKIIEVLNEKQIKKALEDPIFFKYEDGEIEIKVKDTNKPEFMFSYIFETIEDFIDSQYIIKVRLPINIEGIESKNEYFINLYNNIFDNNTLKKEIDLFYLNMVREEVSFCYFVDREEIINEFNIVKKSIPEDWTNHQVLSKMIINTLKETQPAEMVLSMIRFFLYKRLNKPYRYEAMEEFALMRLGNYNITDFLIRMERKNTELFYNLDLDDVSRNLMKEERLPQDKLNVFSNMIRLDNNDIIKITFDKMDIFKKYGVVIDITPYTEGEEKWI